MAKSPANTVYHKTVGKYPLTEEQLQHDPAWAAIQAAITIQRSKKKSYSYDFELLSDGYLLKQGYISRSDLCHRAQSRASSKKGLSWYRDAIEKGTIYHTAMSMCHAFWLNHVDTEDCFVFGKPPLS